ncbi:hypothetical protein Hamer_G000723 [Homarus americanus]|uniref:Uncharacterized protein n=1 Tax=Homarus americanus TaxID=6706 RepID=A0A8J5N258_HOMAM|nr:hypothetical protein Hamer_G000723 [Homarus americanus]
MVTSQLMARGDRDPPTPTCLYPRHRHRGPTTATRGPSTPLTPPPGAPPHHHHYHRGPTTQPPLGAHHTTTTVTKGPPHTAIRD